MHSKVSITSLAAVFALFMGVATAQQSKALLDAPLVVDELATLGHVLDLDGDGDEDAVSWEWSNGYADDLILKGWINDGAGELVPTWTYTYGAGSWSTGDDVRMGTWDFDKDAREDFWLLINGSSDADHLVFQSMGTAPPVSHSFRYGWDSSLERFAGAYLHDWSGNGVLERVLLQEDGWLRTWIIEEFSQSLCDFELLGPGWDQMLLVDGNGDDAPDLLLVRNAEIRIVNMNGCQFEAPLIFNSGLLGEPMPTVGDIDGDNDEDVVVFDFAGYVVVRRTGPTSWNLEPYQFGGPATDLADIDLDGDLDGLCCGGGGGGGPGPYRNDDLSTFQVSLNDGTGVFAPAFPIPGLGAQRLGGAADLDDDGDVDLVAGRVVYYPTEVITSPALPFTGVGEQTARTIGDVDMDGDPDFDCGLTSIQRNRGDGVFSPITPWGDAAPAGMEFRGPGFPGDFDGDGDEDLVVAMHQTTSGAFVSMRFLTNNGGGGFTDAGDAGAPGVDFNIATTTPNTQEGSRVADVDGDLDLDLITLTVAGIPRSQIWINDGSGVFSQGQYMAGARFEAFADLNGDTILDAVLADTRVRVHWGTGNGMFPSTGYLQLGIFNPHQDTIVVRDLDGDTDVDLAFVARNVTAQNSAARWYQNDGSGSFLPIDLDLMDDDEGLRMTALADDMNGDGLVDLVFGPVHLGASAVSIVLRLPDNTGWDAPLRQVVYANDGPDVPIVPRGALVDLDGDGDPELVTDRLAENRHFDGPEDGLRLQIGRSLHSAGGMPPTWGGRGPFRPGESAELRLTGAAPGVVGIFTAGYRLAPFDVTTPAAEPFLITHRFEFKTSGLPSDPAGTGSWTLAYVVPGYKAGRTYRYHVELIDPSARWGYAKPNELMIRYGDE